MLVHSHQFDLESVPHQAMCHPPEMYKQFTSKTVYVIHENDIFLNRPRPTIQCDPGLNINIGLHVLLATL